MPKNNKNNKTYSTEQKDSILIKLLPPNNESISRISSETGIPLSTLNTWKSKALKRFDKSLNSKTNKKTVNPGDKFYVVMETNSMSEHQLAEYCRKNGLFVEEVKKWRASCITAIDKEPESVKEIKEELLEEKKKNKTLERELNRKDKALAEVAALLVLQKKLKAFWGEEEV